jgi:hypothetical protein
MRRGAQYPSWSLLGSRGHRDLEIHSYRVGTIFNGNQNTAFVSLDLMGTWDPSHGQTV